MERCLKSLQVQSLKTDISAGNSIIQAFHSLTLLFAWSGAFNTMPKVRIEGGASWYHPPTYFKRVKGIHHLLSGLDVGGLVAYPVVVVVSIFLSTNCLWERVGRFPTELSVDLVGISF